MHFCCKSLYFPQIFWTEKQNPQPFLLLDVCKDHQNTTNLTSYLSPYKPLLASLAQLHLKIPFVSESHLQILTQPRPNQCWEAKCYKSQSKPTLSSSVSELLLFYNFKKTKRQKRQTDKETKGQGDKEIKRESVKKKENQKLSLIQQFWGSFALLRHLNNMLKF